MPEHRRRNRIIKLLLSGLLGEIRVEDAVIAAEGLTQELNYLLVDNRGIDQSELPVNTVSILVPIREYT